MTLGPAPAPRVKGYLIQCLMLVSINVPVVSFGLVTGWVSLASGAGAGAGGGDARALVLAAGATFAAGLAGVPLAARALARARRPALAATSAAFAACWALTLAGGWWVVAGRACAGAAGALAWSLAPLLGREMIDARAGGAAAAAPVLAHNLGMLLMYAAADAQLSQSTVEWWCLALSALHCCAALLAPESPAYLAARGRHEEAARALARLRGVRRAHPALEGELRALPAPAHAHAQPTIPLVREMLSDRGRRRAFLVALVAVVGQEACGVLSVLQFAERVFLLAGAGGGAGAARLALVLGGVQLVAAAAALYLLERVGRRPLVVWGALGTGAALALAAGAAGARGGAGWAAGALAAAVAADSLGLQPAPYALLADMFHYQYRGCAVLLVMAAASMANAAETVAFPAVVAAAGLWPALALAAAITLLYAGFALICIPETRGRTPEEIYRVLCPDTNTFDQENGDTPTNKNIGTSNENNNNIMASAVENGPAAHKDVKRLGNNSTSKYIATNNEAKRNNMADVLANAPETHKDSKSHEIGDTSTSKYIASSENNHNVIARAMANKPVIQRDSKTSDQKVEEIFHISKYNTSSYDNVNTINESVAKKLPENHKNVKIHDEETKDTFACKNNAFNTENVNVVDTPVAVDIPNTCENYEIDDTRVNNDLISENSSITDACGIINLSQETTKTINLLKQE